MFLCSFPRSVGRNVGTTATAASCSILSMHDGGGTPPSGCKPQPSSQVVGDCSRTAKSKPPSKETARCTIFMADASGKSRKSRERKRRKPLKRQQPECKEKYRERQRPANRKQHHNLSKLRARHDTQRRTSEVLTAEANSIYAARNSLVAPPLELSLFAIPRYRAARRNYAVFGGKISVEWGSVQFGEAPR